MKSPKLYSNTLNSFTGLGLGLMMLVSVIAAGEPLTVMSLNLAHGRGDSLNQMLVNTSTHHANLGRVAGLLKREQADIVALQEADGPSRWSGRFDHVAELAGLAAYPARFRGSHAKAWLFDYGTALLSKWPLEETLSHSFAPSPPTAGKGFVLARLHWPGSDSPVDIVSLHLDFSRDSVRDAQIDELLRVLSGRTAALIVAGDFNAERQTLGSPVRRLADEAGLQAWLPTATDLGSYDGGEDRLDWILISEQLRFVDYRVVTDVVSDHRAVIAVISRKP